MVDNPGFFHLCRIVGMAKLDSVPLVGRPGKSSKILCKEETLVILIGDVRVLQSEVVI